MQDSRRKHRAPCRGQHVRLGSSVERFMTHREAARGDARDGWVLGFWERRDKISRYQGAGKYPLAVGSVS